MIKSFSFDTILAKYYGTEEAIILYGLMLWTERNISENINYHEGYYWIRGNENSFKTAYEHLFTYEEVKRILRSLEAKGAILVGNYGYDESDHTKYYAVTEEAKRIQANKPNGIKEASK